MPSNGETVDSTAQLQAVLQQMDSYDFEHFVADLWTRMGWDTDVSSAAGDKGVDVVARQSMPYEQLLLIQAKRYGPNTTVGSPDIQQYVSLRQQFEDVDKVLIVTTNEFTQQARETADQLNVKLIDGTRLAKLIENHEALDLVAEYLDFIEPVDESTPEAANAEILEDESISTTTPSEPANPTTEATDTVSTTTNSHPSRLWQTVIWVCLLGWIATIPGVYVLSEALWGLVFLVSWIGLPIAIFQDARTLGGHTDWPQYTWAYLLGSLIWFASIVVGGVYLWQRRSALQ
jgi:Restriction endonuclease